MTDAYIIPEAYVDSDAAFIPVDARDYLYTRADTVPECFEGMLSPLDPEALPPGAQCYLCVRGSAGYMLVDGDLQGVFSTPRSGLGADAVRDAIRRGARTLDCFDGYLPQYYARFGFAEVGRAPFDPELAPAAWRAADGTPDVVFMALAPEAA